MRKGVFTCLLIMAVLLCSPLATVVQAEEVLGFDKKSASQYFDISTNLRQQGKYEGALKAIDEAIALEPSVARYHRDRAGCLDHLGRNNEAVEAARTAIDIDSEDAANWEVLARNLRSIEQYEEAMEAISKALSIRPNSIFYYYLASVCANDLGKNEESLCYLDKALSISASNADLGGDFNGYADIYYGRYYVLTELERYTEALKAIEKALDLSDTQNYRELHPDALFNAGKYQEAVKAVNIVGNSYGWTGLNYALRAECFWLLGRYDEALEDIEVSMKLDDQIGRPYRVGAEVYFQLGEYEKALEMIEGALAVMPDAEQYPLIREKIAAEMNKPEDEQGKGTLKVVITARSPVNLRAEGNAEGKILGKGQPGDEFTCTGVANSGWYEILLSDGQTAYVSNKMAAYIK